MEEKQMKRCDELFELEMMFNGDSYIGKQSYNKDFNVHHTEIMCDSDEEWNKKISDLKTELQRRKDELTKNIVIRANTPKEFDVTILHLPTINIKNHE